ncbi:glutamate synthase [Methanofollis formosanus]|uniref:Archaeal glutamate synthase [NADPH] n=1 Tax=Methanofollis formosanus TaxID=299308 RepID=A0A8G1EG00_9EURY|nr:glutamate synthase-related protein [Methanofollis formosanus]QYZ79318.1 glutamate synthase [Methanofollis formosanus]
MARYRCDICQVFEYDSERGDSAIGLRPGTEPSAFPDDWQCPICRSDRSHLKIIEVEPKKTVEQTVVCPVCGATHSITVSHYGLGYAEGYLGEWRREADLLEVHMAEIRRMAATAESILEPMRTQKPVISWDEILVLGAQLARLPLNQDEPVNTGTVIGPRADHPLVIETPIYITHMSFGALSREFKRALAKGSAAVGTAMCSGEGGMLEEVRAASYRYIFEYVPNHYTATPEDLRKVDAVEIKIGQSAKPGMGGHLPAEKVTDEIAAIRGFPPGRDITSPARFEEIRDTATLRETIEHLRNATGGRPVGVKLAAGHIEDDLAVVLPAGPDFVTIDGRPGATAAAPLFVKDTTSVPTPFALHRARVSLDRHGAEDVSLVITGGLRISADFAKALAMGADAVAIGTAALMACACQQYRLCNTGKCPVGVTTQDPEMRGRLRVDISARMLENFLTVSTEELRTFARLTGHDDVHALSVDDLCTTNTEISGYTGIRHV